MNLYNHVITFVALGGVALGLAALDPAVAHAHHCGGTDTSDFSYMGTTCRYQRMTGSWQYNHDLTITDDYDPYIILQRTPEEVTNCSNTTSTPVTTDATITDSDTATYSVGVTLSQTDRAAIASDMAGALGISAEAAFIEGLLSSSTVPGQVGSMLTSSVPGCSKMTIDVSLIGFHNATVSGSVSQKHWYRIHCDDPQYTTPWNVCDTSTQNFTGSSATGCLSRAYLMASSDAQMCAPEELSGECACQQGSSCMDAGTPDTGTPDTGTPDTGTPDAGVGDALWSDPEAGW